MSKHTPGPWTISEGVEARNASGGYFIESDADGYRVICSRAEWDHRKEESLANARLIAAAPELLEALRDLRAAVTDLYKAGRLEAEPFVRAVNVIAKAEGR